MSCCVGTRTRGRRLYRDTDRAVVGGVCAGLASYLGFNLKVTRFLAIVAFFCAMPIAVIGYAAAVCMIPAAPTTGHDETAADERRKEALREEIRRARPTVSEVRKRYEAMDERLAKIEKYVTSSRYELDEKLRKL